MIDSMSGPSCSLSPSRNPNPPKPSTPRLYTYSSHSRSKVHLPQPITLPFPDLPIRGISREGSRSASPAPSRAQTPSRRISGQETNHLGAIPMTTGVSSDGVVSPAETPSRSLSPPYLSRLATSASTPHLGVAGPSRLRAQTTIASSSHAIPNITSESSPLSSPLPVSRTQGFTPSLLSPRTVSPPTSPSVRPSSLPIQPISRPTSIREPKPIQPYKKLSGSSSIPPTARPDTVQITPQHSMAVLGDHLYQMFLKGRCADVRIRVEKWGVAWKVHKMILVQAGFFHSLFLGGFSEMNQQTWDKGKGKTQSGEEGDDWMGEDVELKFDDPNITRTAFEICLSRLYSNHPTLHYPTSYLPTPLQPLTSAYPSNGKVPPDLSNLHKWTLPNVHLATPRLLLSILATTTYLGQAPLMREVLAMVLRSVSPYTVVRYLGFAVGDGIGMVEWEGQDNVGARGMEGVGEIWKAYNSGGLDAETRREEVGCETVDTGESIDKDGIKVGHSPVLSRTTSARSTGSTPTPTLRNINTLISIPSPRQLSDDGHLPHFYGFVSNKIGEAVICWLSRWGADLLTHEISQSESGTRPTLVPVIWGKGGIPANFVRALIGSDGFFVEGEMERYRVARQVINLRRRGWERDRVDMGDLSVGVLSEYGDGEDDAGDEDWAEEEMELMEVFEDGIYYTHMSFQDLSTIAADLDPITSLPYAPLHVLQAAHWSAANLKSRILSFNTVDEEPSDLGLTLSTTDIVNQNTKRRRGPRSRIASPSSLQNTTNFSASTTMSASTSALSHLLNTPSSPVDVYHPVPTDDTYRIGAGGLSSLSSPSTIPGLPDLGPSLDTDPLPVSLPLAEPDAKLKPRPPPQNESTHFGLSNSTRTTPQILTHHSLSTLNLSHHNPNPNPERWTKLPPFRFNVEFWDVHVLVEKERAYSRTVFYAGSWWNVYVQTIRKKGEKGGNAGGGGGGGQQLGIYLHRQSLGEGFPKASVGPEGGNGLDTGMRKGEKEDGVGGAEEKGNAGWYEDPRRIVKAYFSITCSSALGTALIRFSSSPDSFTVSQSWGWKSSALRSEEYLAGLSMGQDGLESGVLGWVGDVPDGGIGVGGSLRASVVVGVI